MDLCGSAYRFRVDQRFMDLFPKEYKKKETNSGSQSIGAKFSALGLKRGNFSGISNLKTPFLRIGLIASIFLLIIILLLWGGLIFYKKTLNAQIANTKDQQAKVFSQKDKELATRIIILDRKASLLQGMLKSHIYTSKIFDTLAATTLPQVQWQSLNISTKDKNISAKGQAANYSVLAKQILALEEQGFLRIKISDILLNKTGYVGFTANFGFDPKLIQE